MSVLCYVLCCAWLSVSLLIDTQTKRIKLCLNQICDFFMSRKSHDLKFLYATGKSPFLKYYKSPVFEFAIILPIQVLIRSGRIILFRDGRVNTSDDNMKKLCRLLVYIMISHNV